MNYDLQQLKQISPMPGVYKMLDAEGKVLYVGKAINLQKRVASYFKKNVDSNKTRALVSHIVSIDITVTATETEALILESSWIKQFRPKYNILMRDDKSYPYIYISEHPIYPNISVIRRKKRPKTGDCFGPYPNSAAVRETMNLIHKVFRIRNCTDVYFNARSRPCLQYQIKRCTAPCTHFISPSDYQASVQDAKNFLQGKSQQIIENMELRMQKAVQALEFEEAARLRDQIQCLRTVQQQQPIIADSNKDADVICLLAEPGFACVQLVQIRLGELVAAETFFPNMPKLGVEEELFAVDLWQQVFQAFLTQRYFDNPERIPSLILTDRQVLQKDILEDALTSLKGKRCKISKAHRGLALRWLEMTQSNLEQALSLNQLSSDNLQARFQALQNFLKLPYPIQRMDCFDVSHFQGDSTVASCVVFDGKGPCKSEYRRYNIQGIKVGDDYAAMDQALRRRFGNTNTPLPDLLIIDGGLGQIHVAERVLQDLGLDSIKLLGVAKGPSRKSGWEELILATGTAEPVLPEHSPARHLIQQIRDEAHRFAIIAHRNKRQKSSMQGGLDTIPGIGPKRRKALLQRFGSVRELAKATVEEIRKVPGISLALAKKILEATR